MMLTLKNQKASIKNLELGFSKKIKTHIAAQKSLLLTQVYGIPLF